MNEEEKEKRIEDLEKQLAALEAPPVPEPDLTPTIVIEERNVVLARRWVGEHEVHLVERSAVGDWKPVFDYLLARKRINDEIGSILRTMPEYADVEVVAATDLEEDDETTE